MLSVERVSQLSQSTESVRVVSAASHERTNKPTDTDTNYLPLNPAANASRAGGLQRIIESGSGQSAARTVPRDPHVLSAPGRLLVGLFPFPTHRRVRRSSQTSNAQGFAARPQLRKIRSLHQHRIPSHTNAKIGVQRHRLIEAACSPLAGWHGRSDGSNPLRPPTSRTAANRSVQCGCVCALILLRSKGKASPDTRSEAAS